MNRFTVCSCVCKKVITVLSFFTISISDVAVPLLIHLCDCLFCSMAGLDGIEVMNPLDWVIFLLCSLVYTYAASAIVIAFHVKGYLDQWLPVICQWHFLNHITIFIVFIMDCTIAPLIVICVSYTIPYCSS